MLLLYPAADGPISASFCIYIPLCFYFIVIASCVSLSRFSFTFHYASTLSISRYFFWMLTISFTFHYASTLSNRTLCTVYCYTLFTFHYASTLSTKRFPSIPQYSVIYIPLCFYFIVDYGTWIKFCWKTYLHSTMLLLYQIASDDETVSNYDLHSTMLLLYQNPDHSSGWE